MRPLRSMNSLYPSIGRGMPYRHQSMVVKKKVYDRVGLFNTEYVCCDYDWVCRWELIRKKSNGKAYYLQGNPVILMDGGGVSSRNESKVILEAFQIILKHSKHLGSLKKIITYLALFKRIFLYSCRFILIRMGYMHILAKIKRIKYFNYLKNP